MKEFSRRELDPEVWKRVAARTTYVSGGYDEKAGFDRLAAHIKEIEKGVGSEVQSLFYISTPPSVFFPIIQNLGASGLGGRVPRQAAPLEGHHREAVRHATSTRPAPSTRSSARSSTENQVYRIDHYLGKETVQDLLVQRFANSIFEPIWNRNYIDSVQITVAEDQGVGTRAGYYEESGCLRDMIQNHTTQLLALTAMEPPGSFEAEALRDEKVKLLKAIQPLDLGADEDMARAQYTARDDRGQEGAGLPRRRRASPPDSATETYAAIRLSINNWRWQGVPFYLRSGKRMPRRVSEIAIQFKCPPGTIFPQKEGFNLAANTLSFQIQPDEGLSLILNAKIPGLETRTQPVKMSFRYATTFGSNTPGGL